MNSLNRDKKRTRDFTDGLVCPECLIEHCEHCECGRCDNSLNRDGESKYCHQCHNRGWYFGVRKNPYVKSFTEIQTAETTSSEPQMIKVCIVCKECDSFRKRGSRAKNEIEEKDELINYYKIYPL